MSEFKAKQDECGYATIKITGDLGYPSRYTTFELFIYSIIRWERRIGEN